MISNAKIRPTVKFEPEGVQTAGGRLESSAGRGTFNSKSVNSTRTDDAGDTRTSSKRYREERPSRGSGRGRGRGSFSYEYSRKGRASYAEGKGHDVGKVGHESLDARNEDCRISKLLRRLGREDDPDNFLAMIKQLQDVLLLRDNAAYIRHSLDLIVESILDLLHTAPAAEGRLEAARCLGRAGYALGGDFQRFLDWVFNKFSNERNEQVRVLLMKALLETALLEVEHPILADFAPALMAELKMALESADLPDLLIASVDVILVLVTLYSDCLDPYFRDTVDILVGWGVSQKESSSLVLHFALRSLHQLQNYWLADTNFAASLLTQLLEDLEGHMGELQTALTEESTETTPDDEISVMVAVLKIFNSVATCITSTVALLGPEAPSLTKLMKVICKTLSLVPNSNLLTSGNIGAAILLSQFHDLSGGAILTTLEYITTVVSVLPNVDEKALLSTLQLFTQMVLELGAGLPADLATSLLGPGAPLSHLKTSPSHQVTACLVQLYQSFLQQPTQYQEVVWLIKAEADVAINVLCSEDTDQLESDIVNAEAIMAFYMEAVTLVVLSSDAGPSVLDLLMQWRPESPKFIQRSPLLNFALLNLIHGRCAKFHHFVTSQLFHKHESSYQFTSVVHLLTGLLNESLPTETLLFVLRWAQQLLIECQPFLQILLLVEDFLKLLSAIVGMGKYQYDSYVVLLVCGCLEGLDGLYSAIPQVDLLHKMIALCCYQVNSTNSEVAERYSHLLAYMPLAQTMLLVSPSESTLGRTSGTLLRNFFSRGSHGFMSNRNFSWFMDYLLKGVVHKDDDWMRQVLLESYPLGLQGESNSALALKQAALDNRGTLLPWLCWEAAQLCVLNKLRTSLGKAPETFTIIESAVKAVAREARQKIVEGAGSGTYVRARLILEFMEYLEKTIYNASEGSAVTLTLPPKNVRTFFYANKKTCTGWLSRVRLVMMMTAVRVGQPAAAVRHGHGLLADLQAAKNTQSAEFEAAILYTAWALLSLHDSEAITGLYVWSKQEADRKFNWLIPMAHHAASRYEVAMESYKAILTNKYTSPVNGPSAGSPIKIARSPTDNCTLRFVYDCFLDCLTRTSDYDNLIFWLEKKHTVLPSDTKNGNPVEKFLDVPKSITDVNFLKCVQEILVNRSSKYHWKIKVEDEESVEDVGEDIKALDRSILAAKLSLPAKSDFDERCKNCFSELTDWSRLCQTNGVKDWRVTGVMEEVKKSLTRNAVLVHFGQSLESKAFVLQMSENNKIEIDLNVNQLMAQWGVRYDFEMSNILKQVKEKYQTNQSVVFGSLQTCATVMDGLLRESLRSGRHQLARDMILLDCVARDVQVGGRMIRDLNLPTSKPLPPSDHLLHLNFWKSLLSEDDLKLHTLKAARKEGNLELAKRVLLWHFKGGVSADRNLVDVCDDLVENFKRNLTATEGELCLQVAKLLYSTGSQEAAIDFGSLTALKLIRPDNEKDVRQTGSRILLTLAKWLQQQGVHTTPPSVSNLVLIPDVALEDVLMMPCDTINDQTVIPEHEMAIGRVLGMSVEHCASLSKTWSHYASWCYRWGRKMVDAASRVDVSLSELDLVRIKQVLPTSATEAECQDIISILSKTHAVPDEENIEAENLSTMEMLRNQLMSIPVLAVADEDVIVTLLEAWREAKGRVTAAFRKAAQAYFKYLQLCGDSQSPETRTLTATLRILRLLVKHAVELQNLLEEELPRSPPQPWQGIIPQLFSRLNHPEAYVRARLSELLCRIAQTSPNLIIFPAVVGSSAGANRIADINTSTSKLLASCMTQNSDEEAEEHEEEVEEDEEETVAVESQSSVLTTCYLAMVDTLSKQAPDAISQVQRFVSELRRITLLWDELWLGTLNQHHGEVTRRLAQLEVEVRKVDNNPSLSADEKDALIAEKHRIIMKPVVFVLEQLQTITSVTAETPHETWFQEKLGEAINTALDKLRNPVDPRAPTDSWQPFRVIHAKLQKRAQKRACAVLKMESVSPVLHGLRDTAIPMPGVCGTSLVTIKSVSNSVIVLPTKTKPKKLVFTSNTGTTHTYLFKGLEDLHLDERIMQLLNIANTMLASRGSGDYRARHYSVTPLGPRSGLISWVDRVIPLFTLYKKWQQRDSTTRQNSTANSGHAAMRPSELFYNKLTPLLKEAGVAVERRKEWPAPLLKQVLQELMKETPKDLLAKELWCNSVHVDEWWATTKRYSRSVAVMSVIGYIIGLGDRHLDNVLIDLHTGEMVHIDYNVCFEKGKTLRVPEKVPFRMTQNIEAALGVTGVEGQFKLSCEHVLKVLKHGRETLLPLLEAFVYDPLIDWTPGSETGYTGAVYGGGEAVKETRQSRKALEREVTRAMFAVRITEMKAEWFDNREKVLQVLPLVAAQLGRYLAVVREAQGVKDSLADAHQQMFLVKEAEAMGHKHPLFNLPTRCAKLLRARSASLALNVTLRMKQQDYERGINSYQDTLKEITGEGLSQWMDQLGSGQQPDSFLMFDLVKQFLQTAGQSGMVTQCDQTETEVGQLDSQQRQLIRNCVDLLAEYGSVIALYPSNAANHRTVKFKQWAEELLDHPKPETCSKVLAEFHTLFGERRAGVPSHGKQVAAYSTVLQSAVGDAQTRLKRYAERLKSEGGAAAGKEAAATYADARSRLADLAAGDKKAAVAVELVIISALCTLNQRFIKMENAAKSAEEGLEGMRLKEGQSWLEEMYIVSGLINELIAMLPTPTNNSGTNDSAILAAVATLAKTHSMFRDLLELHVNFHSIILPEALKCTQIEHPDMNAMLADLKSTIDKSGASLEDLQEQLKLHLRALIMDMKSAGDAQSRVSRLRAGLETLLQRPCEDAGQSPGQMLLMGFHGLFEKLQVEGRQMMSLLSQVPILPSWKKLDHIRDAATLAALILDGRTRSTTEDVFLVKRVQTMQEFFGLCETAGAAFRGTGPPVLLDDDRLNRPIRRFAAEFVSRIMLGVTSQSLAAALCYQLQRLGHNLQGDIESRAHTSDGRVSLEDICQRAVDAAVQKGMTSNHAVHQSTGLLATMQARYRERERNKLLTENVEARERALTRLQALLTAHSWYKEDILQDMLPATAPPLLSRSAFMTKLRKASSGLLGLKNKLKEAREVQRALVVQVEQRLRWAGGANPALVEVLSAFETGVAALDRRLDSDSNLALCVGNHCTAVLRHEALRTRTTEALSHDDAILKVLDQCKEMSGWLVGCSEHVTPAEESLLQFMTPESAGDPQHLYKLENKISESIEKLMGKRSAVGETLAGVRVDCETEMEKLKALLGNHHALMTEVRHLLKSMAKIEEYGGVLVGDYLESYREFTERIGGVVTLLATPDSKLSTTAVESAITTLATLPAMIMSIYDDLVGFAEKGKEGRWRPPLLRQESVCCSPKHTAGRDPPSRANKGVQERNAYAMSVWRRIQMKLEGRDPDPGRRSAPQEQVDFIIREATSLDNLALLYEGWTPWV